MQAEMAGKGGTPWQVAGSGRALQADLPARADAVRHALVSLQATPPFRDLPAVLRETAELALAEALNNVVEHAYASRPGRIRVWLRVTPRGLACRVADHGRELPGGLAGRGMLPATVADHGHGWYLIRQLAQDVRYRRLGDKNTLQLQIACAAGA